MQSKILSYIGFAKKSGKLRCGVNAISTIKGGVKLLIICKTASENTYKDALKLATKFSVKLIESDIPIEEICGKENCKLIAIEEPNLAKAIIDNLDCHFTICSGGKD